MDLLIFIGSTSAFIYSLYGAITSNPELLFFETSAMIITLVLLGNYIEHKTVRKTQSAIDSLKALQVNEAVRINKQTGETEIIPLQDLKVDDMVLVNEGDPIPSDGIIMDGQCQVDESLISGESEWIIKNKGDEVIGSTIAASGNIRIQITRIGSDTVLSNIINLVKRAQREKPDIQQLADKISGIFVPLVIGISLITFIISHFIVDIGLTQSILNSIAVLVISCPCAMGLATPTAIAAGVGKLSRSGILIKSGKIMENFARIGHIVFDKTGTLTTGEFEMVEFDSMSMDERKAKSLVYALEKHSSHPIAKSIKNAFKDEQQAEFIPTFTNIVEVKGKGIHATDKDGNQYFIGKLLEQNTQIKQIGLFVNDILSTRIGITDKLRQNAAGAMEEIKRERINVSILSGDTSIQVEAIAKTLNITSVYSEKSPEEKFQIIEEFNKTHKIAMVGDGINDAAALSRSEIGISMSDASKIAINAADIVLMHEDLMLIPKAVKISKATLKTIKQNLFWAFSYNIIAIPLAAFGFLNPMWGALFMTFSDIMVVGNSIRLIYKKI